jgi:hypothetical protein
VWVQIGIGLGVDKKGNEEDCEEGKEAADVGWLGEVFGDFFEHVELADLAAEAHWYLDV